jgi:hypothetical protein
MQTWVERSVASAWLLTEKHFRRVVGQRHFLTLAVVLTARWN